MPPKNAGGRKKAANGYQMPAPVPLGTLLTDMAKRQWKVGPSIGSGGFGEIYCACEASSGTKRTDDYPYVVKIVSGARRNLWVVVWLCLAQTIRWNIFILKSFF